MTGMKRVVVTIDGMGNPKIEAQNFQGIGCEAATGPIEKALAGGNGGAIVRELKPEYHETPTENQQHATQW